MTLEAQTKALQSETRKFNENAKQLKKEIHQKEEKIRLLQTRLVKIFALLHYTIWKILKNLKESFYHT